MNMKLMRLEVELTDKGKELIDEAIKTDGAVTLKKVVDEEVEGKGTLDGNKTNENLSETVVRAYIDHCIEEMNQKINGHIMSLTNRIKLLESKIEEQNQS